MTVMLYKHPGKHTFDGNTFDYIIADSLNVPGKLKSGWFETPADALSGNASGGDDNAPPTREELEQKANELGIEYRSDIGDERLAERIAAHLADA